MSQEKKEESSKDDRFINTVKHQKYLVLTLLTPDCFAESIREEHKDTYAFKVRGAFEKIENAINRANFFKAKDKRAPTFVIENGKWSAVQIDADYAKELTMTPQELAVVYGVREKKLNLFMRHFKKALKELSVQQKERKDKSLEEAKVVTGQINIDSDKGPIGKINHLTEKVVIENDNGEDDVAEEEEVNYDDFVDSDDVDYLDEDKPFRKLIKHQNFYVVSMLTPNTFPESCYEDVKNQKVWGIKVRGVFETYEDSKDRMDHLQKCDKYNNTFSADIGEYLPLDVNMSKVETQDAPVYREKELNTYMSTCTERVDEDDDADKEKAEKEASKIDTKKLIIENDDETDSNTVETDVAENNQFANQMTTDQKIKNTTQERNDLQAQVSENSEKLDDFKSKLDELNKMFKDLNK